ncbi:MAG: hypothetical protein DKM24_03160 [Candidatus Melainabacteria bacterium]|nr:MAG: hypothetical protein DKM24_03160 [Candidatus Melainabacteria bacterium]
MDKIKPKKYNSLEEFYKDGYNLAEFVRNSTLGISESAARITYARNVYNAAILNSYIVIGYISKEIQQLLNCSNSELKFSMDNMIKNRLSHHEVSDEDYRKIPLIIKNPSKYYKSKIGYDVILFKADEKFYKLVIKTTKSRKENFVKSLHLLNEDRYRKY